MHARWFANSPYGGQIVCWHHWRVDGCLDVCLSVCLSESCCLCLSSVYFFQWLENSEFTKQILNLWRIFSIWLQTHTFVWYSGIFSRPPKQSRDWTNVGLLLVHRLRRWTNIKPTLDQRIVFADFTLSRTAFVTRHGRRQVTVTARDVRVTSTPDVTWSCPWRACAVCSSWWSGRNWQAPLLVARGNTFQGNQRPSVWSADRAVGHLVSGACTSLVLYDLPPSLASSD